MENEKKAFADMMAVEMVKTQLAVSELFNSARSKFTENEATVQALHIKTYEAFQKLEEKINARMGSGEPGERRDKNHYCIPIKNI